MTVTVAAPQVSTPSQTDQAAIVPDAIIEGLKKDAETSVDRETPKLSLPTLERLGVESLPSDIEVSRVASSWFQFFSSYLQALDVDGILSTFVEDAFWRDLLALTWDFRAFQSHSKIKQFLSDRLAISKLSSLELKEGSANLLRPYPDLAWIQASFSFVTEVGIGSGVFRLVPTFTSGFNDKLIWKAHSLLTNLSGLKNYPEKIGRLRDPLPNHGKWLDKRQREVDFADVEPSVLIIGGGQAGLEIAARLKMLDVPTLVVERQDRIGDQWRTRYKALCLHDPVWYDHMAYMPFPPSWPVYTPAAKLADWLESYAHSMELNVWTSSTITHAEQDETTKKWTITVQRGREGEERTFHVNHLIFAMGLGGGNPIMPQYPGMDEFKGKIMHSSRHDTASDNMGKKVAIIGSATSGHDIAADHVEHGVDVTMIQRGPTYIMTTKEGMPRLLKPLYWENGPPTDVADTISASFPSHLLKLIYQRTVKDIAEADKNLLEGLVRRGFKLSFGDEGSGFFILSSKRAGGYYLDVGASQMIVDGKIKLKNDSPIQRFTKTGIKFQNGSELPADVVIFATGYGDARESITKVIGDKYMGQLSQIWGMNAEGELNGAWRDMGVQNLWYGFGNLALVRFHSKHLAMQIKAIEEGISGPRYSAKA